MKDNFNHISMNVGKKFEGGCSDNDLFNTAMDCLKNQGFMPKFSKKALDGPVIIFERADDGSKAALGYSYTNPRSSLVGLKITGQQPISKPLLVFIKESLDQRLESFVQEEELKAAHLAKKANAEQKNKPNC